MNLVFYDGQCGLCDQIVQLLLKVDKQKRFMFASLQGKTAENMLQAIPEKYRGIDSLVLIENYQTSSSQFYVQGKGVLRICWLLGRWWSIPGILNFLPSLFYDWIYRIVARNRHKFFRSTCVLPSAEDKDRFLP